MLDHLGLPDEAAAVMAAIETVTGGRPADARSGRHLHHDARSATRSWPRSAERERQAQPVPAR